MIVHHIRRFGGSNGRVDEVHVNRQAITVFLALSIEVVALCHHVQMHDCFMGNACNGVINLPEPWVLR